MNWSLLAMAAGLMMPFCMVVTTSPPAIRANGRADVVGDIVGADIHGHVAADHCGNNQHDAMWAADADTEAGVKHDGDDEDQADAQSKRFLAASPC
jgi:hypothetical protein